MSKSRKKMVSRAAFIPLGIGLLLIGISQNNGLIGPGVVFLIIGIATVSRHRKACKESTEENE